MFKKVYKKTVWIVGGVDKGNDYNELLDLVKDRVKVYCLYWTEYKKYS